MNKRQCVLHGLSVCRCRSYWVVIDLEVRLVNGLDHEFRDVDAGWKGSDRDDELADVGGSQDLFALFCGDWDGALFEDRGVDFTGVDVGDANAFGTDFVGHTSTEGGHGEFAGGVGHAAQGKGSLSSDAGDVDDEARAARAHGGKDSVNQVVGAGCIDRHDLVPLFGEHFTDGAILDIHAGGIDQDIDGAEGFLDGRHEGEDTVSIGDIEWEAGDRVGGDLAQFHDRVVDDILAT